MPKALITGITGQDGSYLAEFLLEQGYDVIGMVRRTSTVKFDRIQHIQDDLEMVQGDLLDQSSLIECAARVQGPRGVQPGGAVVCAHLVEAAGVDGRVHGAGRDAHAGSDSHRQPGDSLLSGVVSEMFGKVQEVPQTEKTPFWPRSPYGVAKVYGHWITVNYRESYNLFACSGILFNHESPRRGWNLSRARFRTPWRKIKLGQARRTAPGQSGLAARLGLCRRLRARHVADAAAGSAG